MTKRWQTFDEAAVARALQVPGMAKLRTDPNIDDPDGFYEAAVARALQAALGCPA